MTYDSDPFAEAPRGPAGVVMAADPEACPPAVDDDVLAQALQKLHLEPSEFGTHVDQDSEAFIRTPEVRSLVFDAGGAPETSVSASAPVIGAEKRTGFGHSGSHFGAVPLRRLLMAGALIGALGLGWIGGWTSYRFLAAAPASPPSKHTLQVSPCSAGESGCTRRADREATRPSGGRKGAVPQNREVVGADQPSYRASKEAGASARTALLPNERNVSAPIVAVLAPPDRPKGRSAMPVPETRPATIEGWTVREIVGGKAVLEGPNGLFTVSRGDHLPGVGRVDSIVHWGRYWIVATSMGLISTQN